MNQYQKESISRAAARKLRGGKLPHVPPPATPVATPVRLELHAHAKESPEIVFTDPRREHGWKVAMARGEAKDTWQAEVLLPQEPTRLKYHFLMPDGTIIQEKRQLEGIPQPLFGEWADQDFQIAVYDPLGAPPDWVAGTVFYQIFPDRFAAGRSDSINKGGDTVYGKDVVKLKWDDKPEDPPQSRDFQGGDLRGVINKLDYLKDLGVTCIYFTPIFESPTNHRYDASNYMRIDPRLGTEADLSELVDRARNAGIRVLLDGVFNHCSRDSIYFKAAQADKLSPYYRWFNFTEWPDKYEGWSDVKTMPEFVECPEVEAFFFGLQGVAQHWLSYGTAGWRTDVTPWITDEYWKRFRKAVRRDFPQAYIVAEDWGDATQRLLGDAFDATMNYRFGYSVAGFAGGKLTPAELDDRLETLRRDTPLANFHAQMNLLDSHDTPRVYTKLGADITRLMLAVAMQFAYPGAPTVFAGDEAGVEGTYAEAARRTFPWGKEDAEIMEFYKTVIARRRGSKALSLGGVETVHIDNHGVYGFLRRSGADAVLALFNNGKSESTVSIPLPAGAPEGKWEDLLGRLAAATCENGTLNVTVASLGAGWFQAPKSETA